MSVAWLATVLCLLVALLGVIGVISPTALLAFARHFQTPAGLWVAATVRVIVGGALWLSAPASRAPTVVRVVGVAIVLAGLATPFFGLERLHGVVEWWAAQGSLFMRVWASGALVFGVVMAYLLLPRTGTR